MHVWYHRAVVSDMVIRNVYFKIVIFIDFNLICVIEAANQSDKWETQDSDNAVI